MKHLKKIFRLVQLALWGGVTSAVRLFVAARLRPYSLTSFWFGLSVESLSYSCTGMAIGFSLFKAFGGGSPIRNRLLSWSAIGGALAGAYVGYELYTTSNRGIHVPSVLLIVVVFIGLGMASLKGTARVLGGGIAGTLFYMLAMSVFWNYFLPLRLHGMWLVLIKMPANLLFLMLFESIGFYLVNLGMLAAFWKDLDSKA